MGKIVVAEENLQDKLTSLAKAGNFQIGLVIGQNAKDRDFIVHLAPTPTPDEGDLSSEEEDIVPDPKDQSKSKTPDSISKVVDSIVSRHTRQVVRMLPGGLEIIGIFVVTPQTDYNLSANQSKLRSVLLAVHKMANKILLQTVQTTTEKIILHVCTETFKYTCKSVDISATVATQPESVDLKFQRGGAKWKQLSYTYNISLNFWLPKEKTTQSLYKMIISLIKPWAEKLSENIILIDSQLLSDDDMLDASSEEKTPKKKGGARGTMDLAPPKVFTIEILDPNPCAQLSSGKLDDSSGCVRLAGNVAGLAFLHSKATVGEARSAIRVDLVRSVMARWEMHCDSLVEEPPSHLVGPIIHEPPRRVFLEGGGLPVSLCDYLFPGDTCADACQSAKELLGVRVHKEHVDDTLETLPDASEVMEGGNDQADGEESNIANSSKSTATCSATSIIIAAAVVAVGISMSYITLQGSKAFT